MEWLGNVGSIESAGHNTLHVFMNWLKAFVEEEPVWRNGANVLQTVVSSVLVKKEHVQMQMW